MEGSSGSQQNPQELQAVGEESTNPRPKTDQDIRGMEEVGSFGFGADITCLENQYQTMKPSGAEKKKSPVHNDDDIEMIEDGNLKQCSGSTKSSGAEKKKSPVHNDDDIEMIEDGNFKQCSGSANSSGAEKKKSPVHNDDDIEMIEDGNLKQCSGSANSSGAEKKKSPVHNDDDIEMIEDGNLKQCSDSANSSGAEKKKSPVHNDDDIEMIEDGNLKQCSGSANSSGAEKKKSPVHNDDDIEMIEDGNLKQCSGSTKSCRAKKKKSPVWHDNDFKMIENGNPKQCSGFTSGIESSTAVAKGNMEVNITEQCHGSLTALAKDSLQQHHHQQLPVQQPVSHPQLGTMSSQPQSSVGNLSNAWWCQTCQLSSDENEKMIMCEGCFSWLQWVHSVGGDGMLHVTLLLMRSQWDAMSNPSSQDFQPVPRNIHIAIIPADSRGMEEVGSFDFEVVIIYSCSGETGQETQCQMLKFWGVKKRKSPDHHDNDTHLCEENEKMEVDNCEQVSGPTNGIESLTAQENMEVNITEQCHESSAAKQQQHRKMQQQQLPLQQPASHAQPPTTSSVRSIYHYLRCAFRFLPPNISQSTFQGRTSSNACALIAVLNAWALIELNTATVNIINELLSPVWSQTLSSTIPEGNNVYDSKTSKQSINFSVAQAVKVLNDRFGKKIREPTEMIGDVGFTNENLEEGKHSLGFHLDRLTHEPNTAAIVTVNDMSFCFGVRAGTLFVLDSHPHPPYGAMVGVSDMSERESFLAQVKRKLSLKDNYCFLSLVTFLCWKYSGIPY